MQETSRCFVLISVIVVLGITTACGNLNQARNGSQQIGPNRQIGSDNTAQKNQLLTVQSANDAVIALKTLNNTVYVPVRELADALQFQTNWTNAHQTLQLGDNDANYELSMNTTQASKDGEAIKVDQPFLLQGDAAYVPVSALRDLFQEDMLYNINNGQLRIHPSLKDIIIDQENDTANPKDHAELDFAEDPLDPFKTADEETAQLNTSQSNMLIGLKEEQSVWNPQETNEAKDDSIPVLKNIDLNALVRKAQRYLGVKYLFGAGPYPQTGRFDCSTFTQYVYGKLGVKLPRLARQQAIYGTLISRKSLRKGDLLFFYVPGRFKSNRTVGHVGIYMGNMKMINASPKPKDGVQILNINKPYWKETFLRAKRVAY